MRRAPGEDSRYRSGGVPARARPSEARAAAAARLAGATANADDVRRRLAASARWGQAYPEHEPPAGRPAGRQGRSARPVETPARQSHGRSRTQSQDREGPEGRQARRPAEAETDGRQDRRSRQAGPARADVRQGREARPSRQADAEARQGRSARPAGPSPRPGRPSRRRQEPVPSPRRAHAIANPSAMAAGYGAAALAAPRSDPAPHEQSRPRHLKVVEPGTLSAAQRRRRARAVLIATIGMGTFIAFALVYLHVVLAQRQFRIDRLNTEVSKAQTSYQNLRLEVAQLDSPQQIVSTAEGRLGMVQPSKVLYLTPSAPAPSGSTSTGQTVAGGGGNPSTGSQPAQSPAGSASQPTTKSQPAGSP